MTADYECHKAVWSPVYGKEMITAANVDATNKGACPTATSAIIADNKKYAVKAGTLADNQKACCKSAPLCSTTYIDNGLTATGKTACATAGNKVPADLKCFTIESSSGTKCSQVAAADAWAKDLDVAHCCRQMCNDATGGFETAKASAAKPDCPTTGGTYQVSETAYCAGQACADSDQSTCCQKKCTDGFVLHGVTKVTANGNDQNCAVGADRISPTAYCAGSTCAASDASTCCQQKCGDGYELFGGTTTGKRQCATGLRVSPDAFCSGPTCMATDDSTCCETKCDKAGAGFELNGGTTSGMSQCAKDLRVHPTEYCDGTSCTTSSGVCCQQKCTAGFKLKGATGTGTECGADLTVHATAYCKGATCAASDAGTCCQQTCSKGFKLHGATTKESNTCGKDTTLASDAKCVGSPCASSDSTTCCNEKCTDATKGFKVKGGTGKEPNQCKAGETVASKGMCKGDCSSDDASTCCTKANTTATTDAQSSGLAALVGGLVLIVATSS